MNIGDRIKKFRMEKGYSINKLANIAGVSQSYLRDIELGNKNPTVAFLSLICDKLDISIADFFDSYSTNNFFDDPLIQRIYQMSPEQREALLKFLETFY